MADPPDSPAAVAALGRSLVRLQCYEGIESSEALYERNYPRQLLQLRATADGGGHARGAGRDPDEAVDDLFGQRFLMERPLLAALRGGELDADELAPTLGSVLKDRDDLQRVQDGLKTLLVDVDG